MNANLHPPLLHAVHDFLPEAAAGRSRSWPPLGERDSLRDIIARRALHPVFQPIIDFRVQSFIGYEGLIRGPADSRYRYPDALFGAAKVLGLVSELEHACREVTLQAFARLRLPGRLFVNVTPGCLCEPGLAATLGAKVLGDLGLAPGRIVVELTENQRISDFPEIQEVLADYRAQGFRIAIDDLGEGFANLRMWSDVRPDFVKIDRHFIHGIADDRMKYHFVRAMQDLAESCAAHLVAEGIEREEDFTVVRDMGIACGQGYFIAVPEPVPSRSPGPGVLGSLQRQRIALSAVTGPGGKPPTAGSLARYVEPVPPEFDNHRVFRRFEAEPELDVVPVVQDGLPIGLINRHALIDRFARPYQRELYGRSSCTQFMDPSPLIVDAHAAVQELGLMMSRSAKHYLFDGFIVTRDGRYQGIGSAHDLMAMITEMQISAARYANPLTQLPGNVPINEHIDRLLEGGIAFAACYVDIDNFKPYNDHYGYRRGDDIIQSLGRLLREAVDPRIDFVGHVGGDDFMLLFQSPDWEGRCRAVIERFAELVPGLVRDEDLARGGYMAENRRGEPVFTPLPSLSIGALRVEASAYESHRDVAAAASGAKKQAKRLGGGQLFIERRRAPAAECHGGATPGR